MKLYHGSPTQIKRFDIKAGKGRFGNGLYLTPSLDTAKFFAGGGRQGKSGQRVSSTGFIYEFDVDSSKIYKVDNLTDFLKDQVMELESAEKTFDNYGDLTNVEKHAAEWADQEGYDGIDFSNTEGIILNPLPQVLIINKKAIKSAKLLSGNNKVEAKGKEEKVTETDIQEMMVEFKNSIFKGENFPLPSIAFMQRKGTWGYTDVSTKFNEALQKTYVSPITMELNKEILSSREMTRRVVAHELIHVWECHLSEGYKQLRSATSIHAFRDAVALIRAEGHGDDFKKWMNKFNSKYGEGFVDIGYKFKTKPEDVKPYYVVVTPDSKNKGKYLYAVSHALTERALHYINQAVTKMNGKVFKVQHPTLLDVSEPITKKAFYSAKGEEQKFLKNLYEKETPMVLSALACDEDDIKEFINDFALRFRQKVVTLNRIFKSYEKDISGLSIYKPYLREIYRQMLVKFGNCDQLVIKNFEGIFPKYAFSNIYKPKQDQYANAISNWFGYLEEMTRHLCQNYGWLDQEALKDIIKKMREDFQN